VPKIPPRPEIVSHPVYQATMAAQHIAYQLMREVPPDRKAEATRLHVATVHATTYATYALDPEEPRRPARYRDLAASAAEAKERLQPLRHLAKDARDAEVLEEKLDEIVRAAREGEDALGASSRTPAA